MEPTKFTAIQALVGGTLSGRSDGDGMVYGSGQTPPTESAINTKLAELQADYDAKEYQRQRSAAYPPWQDQLDEIYHNGLDQWKAMIKVVKDKHPKP